MSHFFWFDIYYTATITDKEIKQPPTSHVAFFKNSFLYITYLIQQKVNKLLGNIIALMKVWLEYA